VAAVSRSLRQDEELAFSGAERAAAVEARDGARFVVSTVEPDVLRPER